MQWLGRRGSSNVDDRRGLSGGQLAGGGGVIGVIIYLAVTFLGGGEIDPSQLEQMTGGGGQQQQQLTPEQEAQDNQRADFVKVVLAETEDVWNKLYADMGQRYTEPTLVLFRGSVQSACGGATAASGPFYCPGDNQVYIDLSFHEQLQNKFNVSGDFPMAYVIAHEVGHHIQTLNGTSAKVNRLRGELSETEFNKYSVMMELQADFLAGVWAHHTQKMKNILDPGDIDEALNAANAIGDDNLQKQSTGRVVPDAFTHGSSAQRIYWFKKGFETGDIRQGNTFADPSLQ